MALGREMPSFRLRGWWFGCCVAVLLLASAAPVAGSAAAAGRLAFVEADGSLRWGQRSVRLHGIHIPRTGRFCRTYLRPVRCGSSAALALERKIQGLVFCETVSRNRDRSVNAVCEIRGGAARLGQREDLAAFLLREGWALALPGAPFAYHALERIARAQRRGVWGFRADSVPVR